MTESWSPPWAPHVTGSFEEDARDEDGVPLPRFVSIKCAACGATFEKVCDSGRVRQHVATFATMHVHRDVMAPAPGTRGSR